MHKTSKVAPVVLPHISAAQLIRAGSVVDKTTQSLQLKSQQQHAATAAAVVVLAAAAANVDAGAHLSVGHRKSASVGDHKLAAVARPLLQPIIDGSTSIGGAECTDEDGKACRSSRDLLPQFMPASRRDLIGIVGCVLHTVFQSSSRSNKQLPPDPKQISAFHSVSVPSMSIESYFRRLTDHINCSPEALLMGMNLLNRVHQQQVEPVAMDALTIHRLLLTCVMVASKFHDDHGYNNAAWASVGGVSCREMNNLEREFMRLVDYQVFVSAESYIQTFLELRHPLLHTTCSASCPGRKACLYPSLEHLQLDLTTSPPSILTEQCVPLPDPSRLAGKAPWTPPIHAATDRQLVPQDPSVQPSPVPSGSVAPAATTKLAQPSAVPSGSVAPAATAVMAVPDQPVKCVKATAVTGPVLVQAPSSADDAKAAGSDRNDIMAVVGGAGRLPGPSPVPAPVASTTDVGKATKPAKDDLGGLEHGMALMSLAPVAGQPPPHLVVDKPIVAVETIETFDCVIHQPPLSWAGQIRLDAPRLLLCWSTATSSSASSAIRTDPRHARIGAPLRTARSGSVALEAVTDVFEGRAVTAAPLVPVRIATESCCVTIVGRGPPRLQLILEFPREPAARTFAASLYARLKLLGLPIVTEKKPAAAGDPGPGDRKAAAPVLPRLAPLTTGGARLCAGSGDPNRRQTAPPGPLAAPPPASLVISVG